jgi:CTP synthase (UTP-ammonia lyase)
LNEVVEEIVEQPTKPNIEEIPTVFPDQDIDIKVVGKIDLSMLNQKPDRIKKLVKKRPKKERIKKMHAKNW